VWANVSGNLRIVHGLQLIPDRLVAEGPLLDCRFLCRRRVGELQGIRILAIDTVHLAAISSHRVAAAQGLHVPYDATGREGTANPLGISMTSQARLALFSLTAGSST